ncbi:single-stranded DNA-binding protein [Algoriphagus vanfongensis]|uniref:single-stranded DNA-binding protein n=1 Tax=Algoriphagus vanfongensis TaxID=426371 RepID=UPI000419D52B|nr:single-stranded DNA-binding protein [Algoriphagus vanfongensis]
MNALRNKVQLIGRMGDKIQVKTFDSGKIKGSVNLATSETYRNAKGEKVSETTWHHLIVWGKQAEILEKYTDKGSEIAVEGKISNRDFTDKDGVKKYITEIIVHEFLLMGGNKAKSQTTTSETDEEDLPF